MLETYKTVYKGGQGEIVEKKSRFIATVRPVETEEEAGEDMNIVFGLCTTYERQGYIEGIKVGARLMMELMED